MKRQNIRYLLQITLVSAFVGLLFGYDWVFIGGAKIFYEPFFGLMESAGLRGWAMSGVLIGCLAGAWVSGAWSDRYGRKKMLILASALFAVSAYGTGAVDRFFWFVAYRIVGGLGVGIVLAVFQQWCGINVIFNYAHEIFFATGYTVSDVLMNRVVTGITNVIFTFVAIYTVDKWGRWNLMLTGAFGLALIYAILGLCYFMEMSGWPLLLLVVLAIACYAMSLAPVVWVVLSEIFPVRIRGAAMAVSTFFLWTAFFLLTYTFPGLNEGLRASGTFGKKKYCFPVTLLACLKRTRCF